MRTTKSGLLEVSASPESSFEDGGGEELEASPGGEGLAVGTGS